MKALKGLMVVGMMMVAGSAMAQTTPANPALSEDNIVEVSVLASCTVTGFHVDFGTYDATAAPSSPTQNETFTVQCTNDTVYSIGFASDNGQQMENVDGEAIPYTLTDGTTSWFTGQTGLTADGTAQSYDIVANVTSGLFVSVDDYQDLVTISVSF